MNGEQKQRATPGPWAYRQRHSQSDAIIIAESPRGRLEVATVHAWAEYGNGRLPDSANARLIAAAPELLALCQRALNESARVRPDFAAALNACIQKATGADSE